MLDRKSENSDAASVFPATDLVSELLTGMRLVGLDYRRIQLTPPFGIRFGDNGKAHFHFVGRGPVLLRRPNGEFLTLKAGDAVLLPRGGLHDIVSEEDARLVPLSQMKADPICPSVSSVRDCAADVCRSKDALVFTGCMEFDLGALHAMVSLMPEVMLVTTLQDRYPEVLPMLEAMEREARQARAGSASILSRLADVVSAFIVRAWVECGCGDASGWISALRDPRLGRVIAAIHRDPGRNWTVADLAAEMGSSRSVFAERFLDVTGVTPVHYLTEMRMRLAAQWIARDKMPIEMAAHRLGYGSQAAFSRAFKRIMGHPPGGLRAAV